MGCGSSTNDNKNENFFNTSRSASEFKLKFEYLSNLGNGSYAKVKLYRDRAIHGMKFAIKSLLKNDMPFDTKNSLISEITTLKQLDHPNIVKYFETFEDSGCIYIVMEYIPGENLQQVIRQRKLGDSKNREKGVCEIIKCLMKAVMFLHNKNIIHRDIKPENILFYNSAMFESLRLIDFGLSVSEDQEKVVKIQAGTTNFLAPESIENRYTKKSDIWSIGVVLFVLLIGKLPFTGKDSDELFKKIREINYNKKLFEESPISHEAKNLIKSILVLDEENRPSLEECLNSPWIKKFELSEEDSIKITRNFLKNNNIVANFKKFSKYSHFKKEILFYIAKMSYDEELMQIKRMFLDFDKDNTGTIEKDEVNFIFKKIGISTSEEDLDLIWKSLDFHKDGTVNYTEFIAASLSSTFFLKEEKLKYIFNFFGSGTDIDFITPKAIMMILKSNNIAINEREFLDIFGDDDLKKVSFEEFKILMKDENSEVKI